MSAFGLGHVAPSWWSGRLWLLRLGYYKLMRPQARAGDWVWIVDHTLQLGVEKCLVILGIRLGDLCYVCPSSRLSGLKYPEVRQSR